MKLLNICNSLRVALTHSALAIAVATGIGVGSVNALTTTSTINLGVSPSGTALGGGVKLSKIAIGTLPVGSLLRSVAINAKIEAGDPFVGDIGVFFAVDNVTTGVLRVCDNYDGGPTPSATTEVIWNAGFDYAVGTTIIKTITAGIPAIDLNLYEVFLTSGYNGTWSGTVTLEYDAGPAVITAFEASGNPAVIDQNAKTVAVTVPYGTDITALTPTFTLSSGTCDRESGGPTSYDFTNPVVYTVTDGAIVNPYTVTVSVTPASSAKDILAFGILNYPAVISGTNITWNLPIGTDLATLAPDYTVSQFAGGSPLTGIAPDFATTNPQTYTITAQDGSTKAYTVTANLVAATGIINVSFEAGSIPAASTLVGPAGGSGQTWNQRTTFSGSGLADSAGIFTNVGWSNTDMTGIDNWGNPALTMLTSGMRNFAKGAPQQFVINGLTPGAYYNVWIASQQPNAEQAKGDWSTPNTTSTVGSQPIDATIAQNTTTWEAGNNYVNFAHVLVNGSGTIVLNGLSAAGYRLPVNGFQIVPTTAPGNDYSTWASSYLPSDVSVSTADFDGDGQTNQQEYAFGLNPTSGSSVNPITVPLDKSAGTFSYTRRDQALTSLIYTVWTSTDLATWTVDAGAVQTPGAPAANVQSVAVTLSGALLTSPQLFVRMKAE